LAILPFPTFLASAFRRTWDTFLPTLKPLWRNRYRMSCPFSELGNSLRNFLTPVTLILCEGFAKWLDRESLEGVGLGVHRDGNDVVDRPETWVMNRFLLLSALLCLASPAALGQRAAATSGPMVITISKPDCSRLISHAPAPDVAYKPGVDVRGKSVVSADADPGREAFAKRVLPETLEFPVKINPLNYGSRKSALKSKESTQAAIAAGGGVPTLAQSQALATAESKLAGISSSGYDDTTTDVGVVKFDLARNTFTFNGEPLVSEDQRALAEACSRQGVR
jgi:hypothetical protein